MDSFWKESIEKTSNIKNKIFFLYFRLPMRAFCFPEVSQNRATSQMLQNR